MNQMVIFSVFGMSCAHCENTVKNSVSALDGVIKVEVNLFGKMVTVEFNAEKLEVETIRSTIEDQGYEVY